MRKKRKSNIYKSLSVSGNSILNYEVLIQNFVLKRNFILMLLCFYGRPINNAEKAGKSVTVVDIPSNKEVVIRERPHDKFTKKFTFDKVFGPHSKQVRLSISI